MSFSASVKEELCATDPGSEVLLRAEGYGLALFARSFSAARITFLSESKIAARRWADILRRLTGVHVAIQDPLNDAGSAGRFYGASVPDAADRIRVLTCFGHEPDHFSLRLNRANIEDESCAGAFLRGLFIACGTMADPEKEYHLELAIPFQNLAQDALTFLSEYGIQARSMLRKGGHVLYIKESEQIEDFLTMAGATHASLSIMKIKIYKDIRNRANRVTNCETANIGKTVAAAARQVDGIRRVLRGKGAAHLPDDLRELALLRLENPEMSLRELGERLDPPISRSGVNHRMRRLMEMAEAMG